MIRVVFREGKGSEARFFRDRMLDPEGKGPNWTHVGVEHDGEVWHAYQGTLTKRRKSKSGFLGSGVIREPLTSFLRTDRSSKGQLFDVPDLTPDQGRRILCWCEAHLLEKTPFDYDYDFSQKSTLYCSEFVWEAFFSAGFCLCSPPFTRLHLPFIGEREVLLPVELSKSEKLQCYKKSNVRKT